MAAALRLANAVDAACYWSDDPIGAGVLAGYGGAVTCSCKPGRRDRLAATIRAFDRALEER